MNRFSNNSRAIVTTVCVIVLVCLVYFTASDRDRLSVAEKAARGLFMPVAKVATAAGKSVSSWASFVVSFGDVKRENEALRAQNDLLRLENTRLEEAARENERLVELLNLKSMLGGRSVAARVSYRDPGNWLQTVVIDKGSKHGIANGQAVVSHRGIVGRVTSVTEGTAAVMLAVDARSSVGGIDTRSRAFVIVDGLGDGSGRMKVRPLSSDADLAEGDVIITSGLGGVYPKGYVVGDIVSVEQGQYGVSQAAYAMPRVEFERIEEVLVLLDDAEGVAM